MSNPTSPSASDAARRAEPSGTSEGAPTRPLVFGVLTVVIGVTTGLGAAALTWLLHFVEGLVYGHGEEHGGIVTDGVSHTRMSIAVLLVAVLLAAAWWLLRGRGRKLAGVKALVRGTKGPVPETWANAAFQMIGVGAGLPVGREVAPREVASLMAGQLTRAARLDAADASLLVAAAAGAGLGAVYQMPVAGAVYALEVMIGRATVRNIATCLATSVIAVVTSRVVVSPVAQYAAPSLNGSDWRVLTWSVAIGLLLGLPGRWFGDLADHVKATSQRGNRTLWTLPAAGVLVAVVAWWFPLVLGNGRSAAQAGFLGLSLGMATAVLVGKCVVTLLTLRAGAVGGTLAPAIAAGSMAGVVVARVTMHVLPGIGVPIGAVAVLGATAVLATSLRAPATAVLMLASVTEQPSAALVPLALCGAAAWGVSRLGRPLPLARERQAPAQPVTPVHSAAQVER